MTGRGHSWRALVVGVVTLGATAASAHQRSISYSTWDVHGRRAHVAVRLSELDASRLPWMAVAGEHLEQAMGAYLTEHLRLFAGPEACSITDGPQRLAGSSGRLVYQWTATCAPVGTLRIESTLLLDVAASHLHFARLSRDGAPALERVLSDTERSWEIDGTPSKPSSSGTSLASYLALGVEHIWTGYDHLAFLLALLLIGGSLSEVAKIVTGFTVAHSITLGVAVLGSVRPERASVEALIGLSIALVAAENVWLSGGRNAAVPWCIAAVLASLAGAALRGYGHVPAMTLWGLALFTVCYFGLLERVARPAPLRWAIAFVFGLIHGFGFAAVLMEAELPTERLAHALVGFNVGVEIGQLAIVALIWPLLRRASRSEGAGNAWLVEIGSAAVLALGVFWFVTRAYGAG